MGRVTMVIFLALAYLNQELIGRTIPNNKQDIKYRYIIELEDENHNDDYNISSEEEQISLKHTEAATTNLTTAQVTSEDNISLDNNIQKGFATLVDYGGHTFKQALPDVNEEFGTWEEEQ